MERVERQNRRRQDVFSRFGIRWGNFWQDDPKPPIPPTPPIPPMPDIHIPPIEIPAIDVKVPPMPAVNFPAGFPFSQGETNPPMETPPVSAQATAVEGASNEERMQVLKMLREHKITIEEAEELLRALNGEMD
jgi:hypothetical protein